MHMLYIKNVVLYCFDMFQRHLGHLRGALHQKWKFTKI